MSQNQPPEPDEKSSKGKESQINIGLFKGFKGDYEFDIKTICKRAYNASTQNNWSLVLGLACVWVATFLIFLLYIDAFGITDIALLVTPETPLSSTQQLLIELSLTFVLAPLWTGVTMLAISTQRKQVLPVLSIFEYFKMLPSLALASICVDVLFNFGFALFLIPGLYIFAATTFTLPLIADKKLSPIQAIICSIRMSNVYIWKMMQLYILFLALLVLVFISFGFAYLWIGPFYFNVRAVLYQDLFCEITKLDSDENNDTSGGMFDA
jgi:hypothetical protein